jgi:hypothetical protein
VIATNSEILVALAGGRVLSSQLYDCDVKAYDPVILAVAAVVLKASAFGCFCPCTSRRID